MNIYVMKNFSLKEVYFGVAEEDTKTAVQKHKTNDLSPVQHWKWDEEEIKWGEVERGLHEVHAKSFLQALRREPPDEGWIVVFGGEETV